MIEIGEKLGRGKNAKRILEVIHLSNGWILVKTENSKSKNDFKVRTVTDPEGRRFYTPKYAHFAIDFYGKLCQNREKAKRVFEAIIDVWQGSEVRDVLKAYQRKTSDLTGYSLEYILYALKWILDQEDINFRGRSKELQEHLDAKLNEVKEREQIDIILPAHRKGSQLPISIFCDILLGTHPVEALLNARLDISPISKR